jgi:hypothetical protein
MKDLEKFTELYNSIGIEFNVVHEGEFNIKVVYLRPNFEKESKLDGITGCYSTITFDKNGKFVMQGFWDD